MQTFLDGIFRGLAYLFNRFLFPRRSLASEEFSWVFPCLRLKKRQGQHAGHEVRKQLGCLESFATGIDGCDGCAHTLTHVCHIEDLLTYAHHGPARSGTHGKSEGSERSYRRDADRDD